MTPEPGTITRLDDGRYAVHALTTATVVDNASLAELVAARVRKAYGVSSKERLSKTMARRSPMRKRQKPDDGLVES